MAAHLSKNLREEQARLDTFQKWTVEFISPEKLARTGFYREDEHTDKVKCYFCNVSIGDWKKGDDEVIQHLRASNECPLLSRKNTANEAVDYYELEKILPILAEKIEKYAAAGFYFDFGIFTCHCCGGSLLQDYEGEDPWELHALIFTKCEYLVKMKGHSYIGEILSKYTRRNNWNSRIELKDILTQLKCLLNAYNEYAAATRKYEDNLSEMEYQVNKFIKSLDQPRLKSGHFSDCVQVDTEWFPLRCTCFNGNDDALRTMQKIVNTIGVEYITWIQLNKTKTECTDDVTNDLMNKSM